jgi:hypothetical protein
MILHFVAEIFPEMKKVHNRDISRARNDGEGSHQPPLAQDRIPFLEEMCMCFVVSPIAVSTTVLHNAAMPGKRLADDSNRVAGARARLTRIMRDHVDRRAVESTFHWLGEDHESVISTLGRQESSFWIHGHGIDSDGNGGSFW